MRVLLIPLLALVFWLPAATSVGQRASRREREAWQQLQVAQTAYENEDFQEALRHLRAAWSLFPAPVIRLNQGKTFEALERWHDAADAYEDYLTLAPDGELATDVQARIRELRSQCRSGPCPTGEVELGGGQDLEDPEANESVSVIVPLTIAVIGGASLVGGFVSWGLASADESQLADDETPLAELSGIQSRAERRSTIGNVLVPVGATLLAAGIVWLIVRAVRDPPPVSAGVNGVLLSF